MFVRVSLTGGNSAIFNRNEILAVHGDFTQCMVILRGAGPIKVDAGIGAIAEALGIEPSKAERDSLLSLDP